MKKIRSLIIAIGICFLFLGSCFAEPHLGDRWEYIMESAYNDYVYIDKDTIEFSEDGNVAFVTICFINEEKDQLLVYKNLIYKEEQATQLVSLDCYQYSTMFYINSLGNPTHEINPNTEGTPSQAVYDYIFSAK